MKVLDFGLAKIVENDGTGETATVTSGAAAADVARAILTSPGQMMGTVAYMSPEQVRGEELDARTDIFSFGVVIYEMVTGTLPFAGATTGVVCDAILNRKPAPVTEKFPGVPSALAQILEKALEKDRELRYQSVRDLRADLARLSRDSGSASAHRLPAPSTSGAIRPQRPRRKWLVPAAVTGAVLLAGAAYGISKMGGPATTESGPASLTRLTFDDGLQTQPAWSPDGRFIAYSSNQSGNFDIWVQPIGGGRAIQVTNDPASDWQPDWSPDGNTIAFRTERDGGGIFVAPAFGGRERRLTTFGVLPKWAPKGSELMFQVRPPVRWASLINPPTYVVGLDGAPPRRVLQDVFEQFTTVTQIEWHPDGKRVTFHAHKGSAVDGYWTVPISGGAPVQSVYDDAVVRNMGIGDFRHAQFKWAPSGDALYLEAPTAGTWNLWRVSVDPDTTRWISGPERMTTGLGSDYDVTPSPDGRSLAFVTGQFSSRLWSLPMDARTGTLTGEGQALTGPGMSVVSFDLSRNDQWIVYVAVRTGKQDYELRTRRLPDGAETLLAEGNLFGPRISSDGSLVAYRLIRPGDPPVRSLLWQPSTGGETHEMPKGVYNPGSWSLDGQRLLHQCPSPGQQAPASICSSPRSASSVDDIQQVVADPNYALWQARYSPDGRLVLFNAQDMKNPATSVLGVVAATGGPWTRITSEKLWADKARWSSDGKTIYFISNRDGAFFDVWGIRFDPATSRTVGEEFRVTRYDDPGRLLNSAAQAELGVSASRIVVPIQESTGSVWLLRRGTR